jgi:penicillin G amidase
MSTALRAAAPLALALLGCRAEPLPAVDRAAPALHDPATVHFDHLGVAHIRAESEYDAFFLQGYTTARLRMGQMELLRRRAHGTRAEVLGEDYFLDDWQMRALGFTELGEDNWASLQEYAPKASRTFRAYTDGVNAYLAAVEAGDEAPSPQLVALGVTPEPWTPEDSLAIEKLIIAGSTMRISQELLVGLARQFMGEDLFADLYRYAPMDPAVIVPGFVARASLGPPPPRGAGGGARLDAQLGPEGAMALWELAESWQQQDPLPVGSNAFAVAGTHTASGNALLEGDTHQGMGSPAVYTLVDITAQETGLRLVGASFAGVPLVLFGTNGVVAWSATNGLLDHSDLYLEVPDGTTGVVFEGATVPFETTTHDIAVRDAGGTVEDAELRTVETQRVPHHGPVLPTDTLGLPLPLTVSVRWTGATTTSLGSTFRAVGQSRDVDELTAALRSGQAAGVAWVYADMDGRIGASAMTTLPVRERLDPSAPPVSLLPGDGGHEWLGAGADFEAVDPALIPEVIDPPRGFVVASNNDPGGSNADGDPFNDPIWYSGLFDVGSRAAQIEARLDALEGRATWDDMADVQLDTTSRIAGRFLPFLLRAADRRPDLVSPGGADALALLADWDLRCEVDAVAPTLFHGWLAVFMRDMLADDMGLVGELLFGDLPGAPSLTMANTALHWLEATDADIDAIESGDMPFPSVSGRNFFDDTNTEGVETRDELLLASLDQALVELVGACPDIDADLSACTWGRVHTLGLIDPTAAFLPGADVPAQPKPGGLNTVDAADFPLLEGGVLPAHFAVDNAPSNRFAFELDPAGIRGAWVLPGGQSEDPESPHHSDQFDRYMAGELVEMPLTDAEVEAAAVDTWSLEAGFGG